MMKLSELKKRKKELGYTNAKISELSGVPLGTVQKVFSGATAHPRTDTMESIEAVLRGASSVRYSLDADDRQMQLNDAQAEYIALRDPDEAPINKVKATKVDVWTARGATDTWPAQGSYTIEDYYAIPEDVRVELIDGMIYDLAAPSLNHQMIQGRLFFEFARCISDHDKECEAIIAPFDVRLDMDDKTMLEPDIMIVSDIKAKGTDKYLDGPPDLAVEILSPLTREKDCTIKLRKYMNAGVREYWIVDPENKKVMVYFFEKDVLPTQYSFESVIPIGMSGGDCSIDFSNISSHLR